MQNNDFILIILFGVYLVVGIDIPDYIAEWVDSIYGMVGLLVFIVYMFLNHSSLTAIISLLVAIDLYRKSGDETGTNLIQKYVPSESKRDQWFVNANQFPYTLEEEIVSKMAPLVSSGFTIDRPSYQYDVDDVHGAIAV
jgi:hypothetical protein